jgi:hypothetical protein
VNGNPLAAEPVTVSDDNERRSVAGEQAEIRRLLDAGYSLASAQQATTPLMYR